MHNTDRLLALYIEHIASQKTLREEDLYHLYVVARECFSPDEISTVDHEICKILCYAILGHTRYGQMMSRALNDPGSDISTARTMIHIWERIGHQVH